MSVTANEVIQRAYQMATGDDEVLATSDPSWAKYLSVLNTLQQDWTNEVIMIPGERWVSLEKEIDFAISSNGTSFDLPEEAREITLHPLSGRKVSIVQDYNGNSRTVLTLNGINPWQFATRDDSQAVFTYDFVNKRLSVKQGVIDEALKLGNCSLVVTYYRNLEVLEDDQSEVEVDDPNWLVYMLAGEIARTDVIQAGQYGNLIALAQNAMTSMVNRQRGLRIIEMDPWGVKG